MTEPSETTQVAGGHVEHEPPELLDAVHQLSEEVAGLRDEIAAMRETQGALPVGHQDSHGWEYRAPIAGDVSPWVRSLDSPATRRPATPRFLLEILFLVAVAVLAAVARLEPPVIVALLAASWLLVACIEWLAWRSARRQDELLAGLSLGEPRVASDLAWFAPPSEQTAELGDDSTAPTAKLPPAQPE